MTPRSYLYVPGDRAEMLQRSHLRGADAVVADLEDAVAKPRKALARENVVEWLSRMPEDAPPAWVRVNADPAELDADLAAVTTNTRLDGLFLPKAEPETIVRLVGLEVGLIPLVETAPGVLGLEALGRVPGVERIGIGVADLSASLGVASSRAREALAPLFFQVVVVSAASGIETPVAPVSTDLGDLDQLEESTREFKDMGFGARTAIHPSQIPRINDVFTPTEEDVAWAKEMVEAAEGAGTDDVAVHVTESGQMIDEAVLRSARSILAQAQARRGVQ